MTPETTKALDSRSLVNVADIDADTNSRVERALAFLETGDAERITAAMLSYAVALRRYRLDQED